MTTFYYNFRSLSGSSPGAVASVAGTSVGIKTSYPQKFSDPSQAKTVSDPNQPPTLLCSSQSQKSPAENSTQSSSSTKFQSLYGSSSAIFSSEQPNSRASSEFPSLSPRSLSSDFDGPSEHSVFTSSNGQISSSNRYIPSSNGRIPSSNGRIPLSNDCNEQFNISTSTDSNSRSNVSTTGLFQDSRDIASSNEYCESSDVSTRGCADAISDGFFDPSFSSPSVGLSALGVPASEGRDRLMWCSDVDFDSAVSSLSMKGLIELVQSLQDAMVVEQQTFDTLTLQLETTRDPVVQQRLSAALCTSQTRLARLCARNMRCFSQQSLKARHKDSSPQRTLVPHPTNGRPSNVSKTTITLANTDHSLSSHGHDYNFGQNATYDSRAASPRDSGLAVSSTNGSDGEDFKSTSGSPSPPPSVSGAAFKNSLAFFQKAAHLVVNNAKNAQTGARQKESRRRRSGTSSSGIDSACSDSASEDLHSRSLDRMGEPRPRFSGALSDGGRHHPAASRTRSLGRESHASGADGELTSDEGSYFGSTELPSDAGTYEQVLFINGRPQYQDDFRRSYSCETLDSWTNNSVSSPSSTTTVKINLSSSTGTPHRNQKPQKIKHYNNFSSLSRHCSPTSSSTISNDGGWTRVVLDGTNNKNSTYNNNSSTVKKSSLKNYNSSSSTDKPQTAAVKCRSSASSSASSGGNGRPNADSSSSLTSAGSWVGGGGGSERDGERDYALGYSPSATSDSASISVTLPRRKPYLNLQSVTTDSGSSVVNIFSSGGGGTGVSVSARREIDVSPCREFLPKVCGVNIQRSQSFKEGLDDAKGGFLIRSFPLTRTQSYNDGLSGELGDFDKPSLSRAPSIDEILESVRNLRVKKNMVKSTPDLYQNIGEPVYQSASMPRHKSSSKSKSSRSPGASGIIGVRYSSKSTEHVYDRVPEPHYEQIIEDGDPYYENIHKETSYENINHKSRKEVIYDRPKSNKAVESKYDQVPGDLLYENVSNYDLSVYENIADSEPTYMNVTNTNSSSRSKKSRSNKESSRSKSKSSNNQGDVTGGQTYDIPRSATHIYDTPKKYSRSVSSTEDFSEYATPKNNRSVTPSSVDSIQLAKQDQKKKIDDIFAEVDRNVYEDDLPDDRHHPSIPPPDYGAEDEYGCSEYPDEGLGECEGRPYYAEEQGLEVILEEPEEDYCSSPVSHLEEEYPRESNLRLRLKSGERGSLDGSEGIGSAEGDSSGGGSDHYNEEEEEDCASSGIHSQDTPSPSTPIDQYKEDTSDGHQLRHEERIQKDRSIDVYPETLRQRQRNMAPSPSKVDIKNWNQNEMPVRESSSPSEGKKFLPSVKALRSQFETGKSPTSGSSNGSVSPVSTFSNSSNGSGVVSAPSRPSNRGDSATTLSRKLSGSSLASSSMEKSSSNTSLNSAPSSENLLDGELTNEPVEPIFCQFQKVDEELRELMSRPTSTSGWDPRLVLKRLYYIPEMPRAHSKGNSYVNIEGFLEKLPSGRKKATFWNAWKKRYFVAKDGVLYYYQNSQCDKPSLRLTLMGGKVETMEANMVGVDDGPLTAEDNSARMIGVDDGKGHYVVMRCSSKSEAERWRKALETHLVEDFASQYVQPHPMTTNPTLLRDTLIIDIGSCSVRAGVLASQATLPQVFFPTVLATDRESRRQYWGPEALSPEVRSSSSISFPIRPSHRISKYSVDLTAVSSLLSKVFSELKVDPRSYNLQISVPRVLNQHTQSELIKILFEKFGVKGVNITHQSILALYAYNATSGIVVDIGERMDIVPVTDGYIIDGGVSRVPYGGYRILDHLRQFLHMRNVSLVNDVESYIIRQVLESACYCAQHYNTEKARCSKNPENFEKSVSLQEFFSNLAQCPYESVELDFGRFQATEGLFNPDAWGLDHPGLHKLVHKAIQECSMDIRKEMSRSIFLAGGVTQLPGLADRLTAELDNLTPPAIRPKVHVSPYRYHAAFIGACTLAESAAFPQSVVTKENWLKNGNAALRKWAL